MSKRNHISFFLSRLVPIFILTPILLWGCSGSGAYAPPIGPEPTQMAALPGQYGVAVQPLGDVYHEVGPMETIWRISKMYGVEQADIMRANNIQNAGKLKIGQKLLIPQAERPRDVVPLYNVRPWSYMIVHHTATDIGNAKLIDKSHHNRGWVEGLGYHFLIDNGTLGKGNGQIEVGPRWVKQMDGAHTKAGNMNSVGIGVSVVGNFSEAYVSEQQMQSLVSLINILRNHYHIPLNHVMGHRDVPGAQTECTGKMFPWSELMRRLRSSQ